MKELSIFVDESGEFGPVSKYYLLTLVLHDQGVDIAPHLDKYQRILADCKMDDLAFHLSPLMNGHCEYGNLGLDARKRHLSKFLIFAQNLPFSYQSFSFKKSDFADVNQLIVRMKRDVTSSYILSTTFLGVAPITSDAVAALFTQGSKYGIKSV